jgi:hypothetical protein
VIKLKRSKRRKHTLTMTRTEGEMLLVHILKVKCYLLVHICAVYMLVYIEPVCLYLIKRSDFVMDLSL